MTSKNVIIFFLVLLGLFALMWWGRPVATSVTPGLNSETETKNILSAEEKLYDFGTISMADGKVSQTFRVTNSGLADVNLKSVITSCMCTTAYLISPAGEKGPFGMPGHGGPVRPANEIIKAGESRDVRVVYDPAAHGPAGVGPVDRFVYLTDADGGTLELEIKAIVTP